MIHLDTSTLVRGSREDARLRGWIAATALAEQATVATSN